MAGRLAGKRVLVTQAQDYMGPATIELFAEEGAQVVADNSDLTEAGRCEALIAETGEIDVWWPIWPLRISRALLSQSWLTKIGTVPLI